MPSNFAYITKIGGTSAGDGNSEFSVPRGLTTDGNFVWVTDSSNHRIKKLKLSGLTFVAHYGDLDSSGDPISGTGNTGFNSPQDILYWNDLLFVSDSGNNRVKIHRANDMLFIKELTGFSTPKGLTANRQYLWVADSGNNRISRIKLSTLAVEQNAGSSGSGNQQLNGPTQIAYDAHERVIFISDRSNTRILKWDAFGASSV
jgi:DNA-binding beta-propeller fold protein YncE